ncbi:hypothetical protein DFH27DRAFT_208355 [Peziza echinospora]|nr:hypothetical protein DFH27DRAFT_208355 [Peziza echinospora]
MPWATAKVNGVVIAETDFPQLVGGDVYFPPECIRWEYLERSTPTTPTSIVERLRKPNETPLLHYTLNVNGTVLPDAAWSHQDPKCGKLEVVRSHVAFKGMAPVMLMCMSPTPALLFLVPCGVFHASLVRKLVSLEYCTVT